MTRINVHQMLPPGNTPRISYNYIYNIFMQHFHKISNEGELHRQANNES